MFKTGSASGKERCVCPLGKLNLSIKSGKIKFVYQKHKPITTGEKNKMKEMRTKEGRGWEKKGEGEVKEDDDEEVKEKGE